jgi:glutamyl/glutaminyl-tRNA synthetase
VERREEKDFVVVRSDGNPVFHFVNVVDDITMRVTHVIRGEDHLSNTSKHTELFRAFGVPLPVYAHIPLILKQNGPGKMSKRDQGALVEEYQRRGFLPEALVNFLCLLGWSPKNDVEKMPLEEVIRLFDLPGINQSNARFDERKLAHMNTLYLHELPVERFLALARPHLERAGTFAAGVPDDGYLRSVVELCQRKVRLVEDLPAAVGCFFRDDFVIDAKAKEKVLAAGDARARLREMLAGLAAADFGSEAALEVWLQALAAENGVKPADYIHPGRLAVSGAAAGPSFYGVFRVLGSERVRGRIERFLQSLG